MFNFKLYQEGLRRSRLLAALFIAILLLGAAMVPIGEIQSALRSLERGWSNGLIVLDSVTQNPAMFLTMPFFAPFMVLFLFSFLNHRNSSDFYHAIPHKRETLFFSFAAAALTWVIGGIWLSTGVTLLIYAFAPGELSVIINFSSLLLSTLGITVGCVLVIAATLMAMSVTGTAFANIVTALLIIFLPRILTSSFVGMVVSLAPVVSAENFGLLGDNSHNIVFNFMYQIFSPWMLHDFIRGIAYTSVLALLYMGAVFFLFKRRKSETAQNPALSQRLQTAIRSAVAFLFCLPAIAMILSGHLRSDFIAVVTFYALAVIFYFAYELIATKKLRNIKRALPGLALLILLNVVFLTGANLTRDAILNREIPVNQVAHVRLESQPVHWSWQGPILTYEEHRIRQVEIQDPELTAHLLEALAQEIDHFRGDNRFQHWWGGGGRHTVFFETTAGSTIRRVINFTPEADLRLMELLERHPAYVEAALTLPENPANISSGDGLSEEAVREIYAVLREEVRGLSLAEWRSVTFGHHRGLVMITEGEPITYGQLNVWGFIGNENFSASYPVTSLTPRAAELFIYHLNAEHLEDMARGLEDILDPSTETWPWFLVEGIGTEVPVFFTGEFQDEEEAFIPLVLEAIRAQGQTPIDRTQPHFRIHLNTWLEETSEHINANVFIQTQNEAFLTLLTEPRHGGQASGSHIFW